MGRPRTKRHALVENAACLDVTAIVCAGWLAPGRWVSGVFPVHLHPDRRPAGAVYMSCGALFEESALMEVSFLGSHGHVVEQKVKLTSLLRVPFGGRRWFFSCPTTGVRTCRLYLPAGGDRFLSREAHGLRYAVEHATAEDGEIERVCRLYTRISGQLPPTGALSPPPPRQKGMHAATYNRLTSKLMLAQGRVLSRVAAWLDERRCGSLRERATNG
jgi:hypothetical protein